MSFRHGLGGRSVGVDAVRTFYCPGPSAEQDEWWRRDEVLSPDKLQVHRQKGGVVDAVGVAEIVVEFQTVEQRRSVGQAEDPRRTSKRVVSPPFG